MSDFSKLKVKKNSKEYVLNVCTQDTEQNITGTKNFSKLTVNSKNIVRSVNGVNADANGNVTISTSAMPDYTSGISQSINTTYTASYNLLLTVTSQCGTFSNNSSMGFYVILKDTNGNLIKFNTNNDTDTFGNCIAHNGSNNAGQAISGILAGSVFIPKGYTYKVGGFGYNSNAGVYPTIYPLK